MAYHIYKTVQSGIVSHKKTGMVIEVVLKETKWSDADISVHLIGDTRMKTLNKRYRGKPSTTDVLSFPTEDPSGKDLGDIFISVPQIMRQAKEYGVTQKEEYVRMLVHGILHLMGYDHMKKSDATQMFTLQERLVEQCLKQV